MSKIYHLDENEEFYALKDFTYSFNDKGLYFIEGKSGSGKSTIANLAALLDKPSKGSIYFKGKDISKWSLKRIDYFHAKEVGVIFQHYNLLKEETVLFNVMLPTFSFNLSRSKTKHKAIDLLEQVGIKEELFNHKAKDLSGGEMQRVAIARALMNDPSIIIADEPTGALDEQNGEMIMKILKEISKDRLVILISHNKELVKPYFDYVLHIKDGKVENSDNSYSLKEYIKEKSIKKGNDETWINRVIFKRLKTNFTKNVLVYLSLVFSFVFLLVMIGFIQGASIMGEEISYNRIDYGVGTLSYTETKHINNSSLSLKKMSKIPNDKLFEMSEIFDSFYVLNSYDFLTPPSSDMKIGDADINQILFTPIYSFDDSYIPTNLLIDGYLPTNNKGVVVNKLADEKISNIFKTKTSIGQIITLDIVKEIDIKIYKGIEANAKDIFTYDKSFIITGVVEDFTFLSVPKIYYSAKQVEEELQMNIMVNLSYKFNEEITFYDYINNASTDSEESSYMHKVYYKNFKDIKSVKTISNQINDLYHVDLNLEAIMITDTFNELMDAAIFGVSLFVLIGLIGSLLILGISSFSSYVFEKRNTAIMYAFGINKKQISQIFVGENLIVTTLAFITSILLIAPTIKGINIVIKNIFNLSDLIINPLQKFDISVLFLGNCIFLLLSILVYLCTIVPLELAGKINIKEELSDE